MAHLSVDEARAICGGLSTTTKMPCPSYNLPARACKVGATLVGVKGSVCHHCYALKGKYPIPVVQNAMRRRLDSLTNPLWVAAIVTLIEASSTRFFRWHDSGDLQSTAHLNNIIDVCKRTRGVRHWLPTREGQIVRQVTDIPRNLAIRVSATLIDQAAPHWARLTSTVVSDGSETCPAHTQENQCGTCRRCWDRRVTNVSYRKH
jgi:hypothetical protein